MMYHAWHHEIISQLHDVTPVVSLADRPELEGAGEREVGNVIVWMTLPYSA